MAERTQAVVHCAALGQHGRAHAMKTRALSRVGRKRWSHCARRVSMMWTSRLDPRECCQHLLLARRPGRPGHLAAGAVEDQGGRRPRDADPPDQVEVLLRVELHVPHARNAVGDVREHPAGRAARRAEGAGELQQRGPLPEPVVGTSGSAAPVVEVRGLETGAARPPRPASPRASKPPRARPTSWVPRKRPSPRTR